MAPRHLQQWERVAEQAEASGDEVGRWACDIVVADFDDPDSVAAAMAGVSRLFPNRAGAVPSSGAQPMVHQQIAAVDAAVTAGV